MRIGDAGSARFQSGFTLLEVMIGLVILVFVAMAMTRNFGTTRKAASRINDKAFAAQKVAQMLAEVRSMKFKDLTELDSLADGVDGGGVPNYKEVLTVKRLSGSGTTLPGDPISGNAQSRYVRWVRVDLVSGDLTMRRVYISVHLNKTKELLAEGSNLFSVIPDTEDRKPVQRLQIYELRIGGVPIWKQYADAGGVTGWPYSDAFSYSDAFTLDHNKDITLVQSLGFGRDPYYAPYLNEVERADTQDLAKMKVYYYPGTTDNSDTSDKTYNRIFYRMGEDGKNHHFPWSPLQGRTRVDNAAPMVTDETLFAADRTSYLSSMADQYNHCVRYPDEYAYQQATCAVWKWCSLSWRMLLEKMNSSPEEVRNAFIVNMHGETVPMPPMRNYSDAAKNPIPLNNTDVRVVTHPEQLRFNSGSEVKLRVYAYVIPSGGVPGPVPITILISSNIAPGVATVQYAENNGANYAWTDAVAGGDATVTYGTPIGKTKIIIPSCPVTHPQAANGAGLPAANRLYGLEYIPCPLAGASGTQFTPGVRDLIDTNNGPKNTARFVITLPAGALPDGQYTIETRIGNDVTSTPLTTGNAANQPTNISRTYVWLGVNPPATEQYQFMGDPRHMPYADVKAAPVEGYNWYFGPTAADLAAAGYPGYDKAQALWDGKINVDVPRFFQLLRQGIVNSEAIWDNMPFQAFDFIGLGGEIGYPQPDASRHDRKFETLFRSAAWDSTGVNAAATASVDEMVGAGAGETNMRLIARTDHTWVGLFWLGELYPDNEYSALSAWRTNGNLKVRPDANPTAVPSQYYYRARYNQVFTFASQAIPEFSAATPQPVKQIGRKGLSSFLNGNDAWPPTAGKFFNYDTDCNIVGNPPCSRGLITLAGTETSAMFADFPLPAGTGIPPEVGGISPPFGPFNDAALEPPEWNSGPYNTTSRSQVTKLESYYETKGAQQSLGEANFRDALVSYRIGLPNAPAPYNTRLGTLLFNSFPEPDARFVQVTWSAAARAFLSAGWPYKTAGLETAGRIPQLPYLFITQPVYKQGYNVPAALSLKWMAPWKRWDGANYTSAYPADFEDDLTDLNFAVIYKKVKPDAEAWDKWCWINPTDSSPKQEAVTEPYTMGNGITGDRLNDPNISSHYLHSTNPASNIVYDAGTKTFTFTWNTPDNTVLTPGEYMLHIEAFRANRRLHHSLHERRFVINP